MNSDVQASVIVPTWNRPELLGKTLEGFATQQDAPPFEVLVVENGSAVTESLRSRFPQFHFFQRMERGVCAARNLGLRQARGELLIFLDDDVLPSPRLVAAHLHAQRGSANRVVIGRIDFTQDRTAQCFGVARNAADSNRWTQRMLQTPGVYRAPADFATGNFSLRRDLLQKVGGFDEAFDPYGGEEMDLALRLEQEGAQFVFEARACGLHVGLEEESTFYEKARLSGRAFARLLRKYGLHLPEIEGSLVLKSYTTWRGICFRLAFQHFPWLVRAVRAGVGALTRMGPLGQTPLAALDYRIKLHYAFWSGVREVIGWRELKDLIRPRFPSGARHAVRT